MAGKKLFIGNLSFSVTDESLKAYFAPFGEVILARVVRDGESGRSRGFGFVEFATDAQAETATADLNGKEMEGRALTVGPARERTERPGGGGRGGYSGGGYGGGGGGSRRSGGSGGSRY